MKRGYIQAKFEITKDSKEYPKKVNTRKNEILINPAILFPFKIKKIRQFFDD